MDSFTSTHEYADIVADAHYQMWHDVGGVALLVMIVIAAILLTNKSPSR